MWCAATKPQVSKRWSSWVHLGGRHHDQFRAGGWGWGQNVTVLFFIGMMISISRSGCQIIGIKRKSQETVSVICKSWLNIDYVCTSKKVIKTSLMVQ